MARSRRACPERSRGNPGDACRQMLFGAFRPQTTREIKKSQPPRLGNVFRGSGRGFEARRACPELVEGADRQTSAQPGRARGSIPQHCPSAVGAAHSHLKLHRYSVEKQFPGQACRTADPSATLPMNRFVSYANQAGCTWARTRENPMDSACLRKYLSWRCCCCWSARAKTLSS